MPTKCLFELDRSRPIYNSGECINGRILLTTNKLKRVNAIYVSLEGEANVQWSISGKESASYFGHQQYLYSRASVLDNSDFLAGMHIYLLTLHIPRECPSSCSGPFGYIAYNISLVIDKPRCFNEVFRQPIYVIQTLDLNIKPDYALAVREEGIKYLCQWPCSSGPLCFNLTLPYAGYTSGQYISYILEIDNQSPHYDVLGIEASLKQHFVFLARKPLKRNYHTKTLSQSYLNSQTLRLTKRIYNGTVFVPKNTPRSTLNLNYIVFLHYTLQVKLKMGFLHYDGYISAPVIIGTVPIRRFLTEQTILRNTHNNLYNNIDNNRNMNGLQMDSLVTTQPTNRLIEENEESIEEINVKKKNNNDKPPTYESCLPHSFSFAMQNRRPIDLENNQTADLRNICIQLQQFPSYNTFPNRPQIDSYKYDDPVLEHNASSNNKSNIDEIQNINCVTGYLNLSHTFDRDITIPCYSENIDNNIISVAND